MRLPRVMGGGGPDGLRARRLSVAVELSGPPFSEARSSVAVSLLSLSLTTLVETDVPGLLLDLCCESLSCCSDAAMTRARDDGRGGSGAACDAS